MNSYKGVKRSYFELVEIFKKEIVEKQGGPGKPMRDKYFQVIELLTDLNVSFRFYYEYAYLKQVLIDYYNVLNHQLNPQKITKFNPNIAHNNSHRFVYNTQTQTPKRSLYGFGEVQLDTTVLQETPVFDNIQSENFGIIFETKNYCLNSKMYDLKYSPFAGNCSNHLLMEYSFINLRKQHYRQFQEKSDNFKLFENDYTEHLLGFDYDDKEGKVVYTSTYPEKIHKYLETRVNRFTIVSTGVPGHHLTTLIHRNESEGINIFVIDSNHAPLPYCQELTEGLQKIFAQRHPTLTCKSYYLAQYSLNFGHENDNIYETNGYCQLVGFLFSDILYRNIVFHDKLNFDASSTDVIDFINRMKQYCVHNFYEQDHDVPLWKFKLLCFNFNYKVMSSVKLFNTDQNQPLDVRYYDKYSIDDIQNHTKPLNYQNVHFGFKSKLREYFAYRLYMNSFIGINWTDDSNYAIIPQKDNNYYFFVPEVLSDSTDDSDICNFIGINTGIHFQVENSYSWARINNQDVPLGNVHFLFIKIFKFMKDALKYNPMLIQTPQPTISPRPAPTSSPRPAPIKKPKIPILKITPTFPLQPRTEPFIPRAPSTEPFIPREPYLSRKTYIPIQTDPLYHTTDYNQVSHDVIKKYRQLNPHILKNKKEGKQRMKLREQEREGKISISSPKQKHIYLNYNYSHAINRQCSDATLDRDRVWYQRNYQLMRDLYELVTKQMLTPDYIYPRISHLLNCMINRHNWIMNAQEISNTYIELQRRINDKDHIFKDHLKVDELKYLIKIVTDLNKYGKEYSNKSSSS